MRTPHARHREGHGCHLLLLSTCAIVSAGSDIAMPPRRSASSSKPPQLSEDLWAQVVKHLALREHVQVAGTCKALWNQQFSHIEGPAHLGVQGALLTLLHYSDGALILHTLVQHGITERRACIDSPVALCCNGVLSQHHWEAIAAFPLCARNMFTESKALRPEHCCLPQAGSSCYTAARRQSQLIWTSLRGMQLHSLRHFDAKLGSCRCNM